MKRETVVDLTNLRWVIDGGKLQFDGGPPTGKEPLGAMPEYCIGMFPLQ